MNQIVVRQSATVDRPRAVEQIVAGVPTSDGAGVRLTRVLTERWQRRLDPFLMLDSFRSDDPDDYIAGFPDHPHRGFETITYMLAGRMRHRDSTGNEGLLEPGAIQWMLAGRGLIHSEMPEQEDGLMEGFQLWLNLPARDKMTDPLYRDVQSDGVPMFRTEAGAEVRVILGSSHGVEGAVQRPVTEPLYLDVVIPEGAEFAQPLAADMNAFVYVYRGTMAVGRPGQEVGNARMAVLANSPDSDGIVLRAQSPARAVLIAGRPLREPIVQHGPFVMNRPEEIHQAIADYRSGLFGRDVRRVS